VIRLSDAPDTHRDVLFAALTDDRLLRDTRSSLVGLFADDTSDRVTGALATLSDDDDCQLAMEAAQALADRGDPSHLPARPTSHDLDEHMRAFCRLQYDLDDARRDARLRAWIGKTGVEIVSVMSDDYFEETGDPADHAITVDAAGDSIERDGRITRTRTRAARAGADVETFAAMTSLGWSCNSSTGTCATTDSTNELSFATVGGSLVLSRVTTTEYSGCGC
jgi:hypothetical protein